MLTRKHAEWAVLAFFAILIAVVFQQINTSMVEQGIASGGPYDNAASYPGAVAILMGVLMAALLVINRLRPSPADDAAGYALSDLKRPVLLILIFAVYLAALGTLGYHLSTPPMIAAFMILSGLRRPLEVIMVSAGISFVFAFLFEVFLKIVLPGGMFGLNIPW